MKQSEILTVLAEEYGSKDLAAINQGLKSRASEKIKFKLMGESFGHIGMTVAIKMVTDEGLKVFDVNRVRLVRFTEIETFEKAKPKTPRPVYDKPKKKTSAVGKPARSSQKKIETKGLDDDDEDSDDDFEEVPKSRPRTRRSFIPSGPRKSK